MASSIDNAFITQYGRRKPKMPQKRIRPPKRKPIPVPSHEELMEGRKRLKPYKPKPKKFEDIEKKLLDEMFKKSKDRIGKPVKPKPKAKPKPPKRGDKKFKVEKPIYRGESLGKGKLSQEV